MMKTRAITIALACILLGVGWYLGSTTAVANAQVPEAPQTVNVPKAYGQYKGAAGEGVLAFEAADGTLRFVFGGQVMVTVRRN